MPHPLQATNLKDALDHLQARYRFLSVQAKNLMNLAKETGKSVPCEIAELHNKSVSDHMRFGKNVFNILEKNKLHAEQIIYHEGQPSLDKQGNVRTLKIDAPLSPPVFSIDEKECALVKAKSPQAKPQKVSKVAGDASSNIDMGLAPLVIAAYAIGGLIVVSISGYVGVKLLQEIRFIVQGPDYNSDKEVSSYLRVYNKLKADGMDPAAAAVAANKATTPPEQGKYGTGWIGPAAVAIAALGAASFAYVQYSKGHGHAEI